MYLKDLTSEKVKAIYKRLLKSMLPLSKLPVPYDAKVMKRKPALLARFNQIKQSNLEVDTEKAVYKKSPDGCYYIDSNEDNRYLYSFEVLMVPIKNNMDANNIIISGVNYSTSITNRQYFTGEYKNEYTWFSNDKNEEELNADDIDDIIRKSIARKDISDNENISTKKLKVPCVVIAHLVSQKIDYRGGYGKSKLVLSPFSTTIAETIEDAARHLLNKEKYYPSGVQKPPTITSLLEELLVKRWDEVKANSEILYPYNDAFYDPWSRFGIT